MSTFKKQPKNEGKESSLKGTLASVFILGFILIAAWFGVFYLYLVR